MAVRYDFANQIVGIKGKTPLGRKKEPESKKGTDLFGMREEIKGKRLTRAQVAPSEEESKNGVCFLI